MNKTEPKLFVTGGWGYGNIGDDAILLATLQSIQREIPGAQILLTSFDPAETRFHHDRESIRSFHWHLDIRHSTGKLNLVRLIFWLALRWVGLTADRVLSEGLRATVQALRESDLMLMAGGGYFNDRWRGSFVARLAEIWTAAAVGVPSVIYGQTVGPFASRAAKALMPRTLKQVAAICYRDIQSKRVLQSFEFPMDCATHTADEANLIPVQLRPEADAERKKPRIGVMIQKFRPYESSFGTEQLGTVRTTEEYEAIILRTLERVSSENGADLIFLPSTTWDQEMVEHLMKGLDDNARAQATIVKNIPVGDYVTACRSVDVMLSTNMHPLILASASCIPCVAISYFYKVDDFMDSIGLAHQVTRIDEVSADGLVGQVTESLRSKASISEAMKQSLVTLKSRANKNVAVLARQISGGAQSAPIAR